MRKLPKVFDWLVIIVLLLTLSVIVSPRFTRAGEESLRDGLSRQLDQLRSAIELYAQEHGGQYPQLGGPEHGGWMPLLEARYINEAPLNLHVSKSLVMSTELTPEVLTPNHHVNQTDVGWFYNPLTGRIIANGFDSASRAFHDEAGYEPKSFTW
ncbi:MAG: hypothetical protein ACF8GE_06625 [Phycisphaerales bacterium JB043]